MGLGGGHQEHSTHKELIAGAASLKAGLLRVAFLLSKHAADRPLEHASGALQAGAAAAATLQRQLHSLTDVTVRLPRDTSKRLLDVSLPSAAQQLLAAAARLAAGAQPPACAGPIADAWRALQQLVAGAFDCLGLLATAALLTYRQCPDAVALLRQLSSSELVCATTKYLEALWGLHTAAAAPAGGGVGTAEGADEESAAVDALFPAPVSAFACFYGSLVSGLEQQPQLEELQQALLEALAGGGFVPAACRLQLAADRGAAAQQLRAYQQAGWQLLSLAHQLALRAQAAADGALCGDAAAAAQQRHGAAAVGLLWRSAGSSPRAASSLGGGEALSLPGSPPSSLGVGGVVWQGECSGASSSGSPLAQLAPSSPLPLQSLSPELAALCHGAMLAFLHERLVHALQEGGGAGVLPPAALEAAGPLLPGRVAPEGADVLDAAQRALVCMSTLLHSGAGGVLLSAESASVTAAALHCVLWEGGGCGSGSGLSGPRGAQRAQVALLAAECLRTQCACMPPAALASEVPSVAAALAAALAGAGAAWAGGRAGKGPCASHSVQAGFGGSRSGGAGLLAEYTDMAADCALALLALLPAGACCGCACDGEWAVAGACTLHAARDAGASGARSVAARQMVAAGVLPASEQLFRQVPAASAAHAAAAQLLAALVPAWVASLAEGGDADGAAELAPQLSLFVSLRKFLASCCGLGEPDREHAVAAAAALAGLVARLAGQRGAGIGCDGGAAGTLSVFVIAQLLPGLQVFTASLIKAPTGGAGLGGVACAPFATVPPDAREALLPAILAMLQALAADGPPSADTAAAPAAVCCGAAQLLAHGGLAAAASILGSVFYTQPSSLAASILRGEAAAGSALSTLEALCSSLGGEAPRGSASGWRLRLLAALVKSRLLAEVARCLQHLAQLQQAAGCPSSPLAGVSPGVDCLAFSASPAVGGMAGFAQPPRISSSGSMRRSCSSSVCASPHPALSMHRSFSGGGGTTSPTVYHQCEDGWGIPRSGSGSYRRSSNPNMPALGSLGGYSHSGGRSQGLLIDAAARHRPGSAARSLDLPSGACSAPPGAFDASWAAVGSAGVSGGGSYGSNAAGAGMLSASLSAVHLPRSYSGNNDFGSNASLASLGSYTAASWLAGLEFDLEHAAPTLRSLQARLDALALAVAEAASGALVAAAAAAAAAADPAGRPTPAYMAATGDPGVMLRQALAAARAAAAATASVQGEAAAAADADADTGAEEAAAVLAAVAPLPPALLRRLLQALGSASLSLVRLAAHCEADGHADVLLAALPLRLGCWNAKCCNLSGACEGSATLRPCPDCRCACFCSKACEKAARQAHLPACRRLARSLANA